MNTQNHLAEQELVEYVLGDSRSAVSARHLGECTQCAREVEKLRAVLLAVNEETLPVPPREYYAEQVWASVKPRLGAQPATPGWLAWFRPQRLALAGGLLVLAIVAFVAGRFSKPPQQPDQTAANGKQKERVVLVAVGDHLERSQMMLVELANAEATTVEVDISSEQERARDLLVANRLYRTTAKRGGDPAVSAVLDELERVLVEIANSPSELSQQRLAELQQQISDQGILFKVRVIGSKVRSTKERETPKPQPGQRIS